MDKLKLKIEELAVESFATAAGEAAPGTVFARSAAPCDTWDDKTCPFAPSCDGQSPTCDGRYTCVEEKKWYIEDGADPTTTGLNCTGNCTANYNYCFGGQP